MADCRVCGHPNPEDAKFCTNCGTALIVTRRPAPAAALASPTPAASQVAAAPPASASPAASPGSPSAAPAPKPSSLLDSLRGLGIRPTCGQIAGFVGAVVFGLVLARALPFVFPAFYPILDFVFRDVLGREPDAFNTAAMTWLTCLSSAGVAFASTYLLGRRRKKGGG